MNITLKRVCLLLFTASVLQLGACLRLPGTSAAHDGYASFDNFTEELFLSSVTANTINLHYTLSDPESFGIYETPISLGDPSPESLASSYSVIDDTLETLSSFDYETLSDVQKLTYDIIQDNLQHSASAKELYLYYEPLAPSTGIQSQLPVLYEEYRFYDRQDVEDYLALIALTGDYFDKLIEFEREKAAKNLFMSDFACDDIISQCEAFLAKSDDNYLITTFDNKIETVSGLSTEEISDYKARNASLVKNTVLPAYRNLVNALTAMLGSGRNDMGLACFDGGKDYYRYLVYENTGDSRDISEIKERIEAERSSCLSSVSLLTENNTDLIAQAQNISLENIEASAAIDTLRAAMLSDFPESPDVTCSVSPVDECMEDYMAPAFYITSPIDDYDTHSIFINNASVSDSLVFFTTLAHEGFPGHLYQTVMSYEADLPAVRYVFDYPGYVEGWATYVEMISYGYAGLDEAVASYLMYNQSALLSLYASTDIGIHYDGWSLSDTISFWSGYGITSEDVIKEIYEFIVQEPTHYLKYYVGCLNFLDLRDKASEALGENFDIVSFHEAVLSIGPAPFSIVEKYLNYKLSSSTSL